MKLITISRQYGSGGERLREVSKETDIPFYDKKLITRAAKESGL